MEIVLHKQLVLMRGADIPVQELGSFVHILRV